MQVLQHAFRLYVARDKFEQAIAFYERIQDLSCERRVHISETGIDAAKVGGFLIFTGAPESLARVHDVAAIFYVDSLAAFVPWLTENGAEILAGPRTVTGGKNATAGTLTASSWNILRRRGEIHIHAWPAVAKQLTPRATQASKDR
jgi:predicted enzyme related to lactoylglutathione lyase